MINYKDKPFNLSDEKIKWVEDTYEKMTLDEKIGQLFCPVIFSKDENELKETLDKYKIGGLLYREGPGEEIWKAQSFLQKESKIPLLIAANLE